MRCIAVATDGSDGADRAIDFAADLASKFGADLVLVHVISASAVPSASFGAPHPFLANPRAPVAVETLSVPEVLTDAANDLLAKAKARAEVRGARRVHAEVHVGDPAEAILSIAKERNADVIVLGKRGQGRLAGLLLGSISQKVATLAHSAVLVVP